MGIAVVIGDEATRPEIENAIRNLWERRARCSFPVTRLELEGAVDELLDRLLALGPAD